MVECAAPFLPSAIFPASPTVLNYAAPESYRNRAQFRTRSTERYLIWKRNKICRTRYSISRPVFVRSEMQFRTTGVLAGLSLCSNLYHQVLFHPADGTIKNQDTGHNQSQNSGTDAQGQGRSHDLSHSPQTQCRHWIKSHDHAENTVHPPAKFI